MVPRGECIFMQAGREAHPLTSFRRKPDSSPPRTRDGWTPDCAGVTIAAGFALALLAAPVFAAQPVEVTPILSTQTTASGQPIRLPQHDVQLVVSRYVIPPGATLAVHKHPSQRYAYVLSGHLTVTLSDTGQVFDYKPGDFVVEVRDEWHYGTATGTEPVVLLVIDQVEPGQTNTVLRDAH
jgi:quercetin dioxygenase-like cupin family protein